MNEWRIGFDLLRFCFGGGVFGRAIDPRGGKPIPETARDLPYVMKVSILAVDLLKFQSALLLSVGAPFGAGGRRK